MTLRWRLFAPLAAGLLLVRLAAAEPATNSAPNQWFSAVTERPLTLEILPPANPAGDGLLPTIFYLKNLAVPRVGTESNETILRDFHKAGYLVITLDYAQHPQARVPFLNRDLFKLRTDLLAHKILPALRIDLAHTYIVPEGCRLKRDVLFYRGEHRPLALDIIYPSHPAKPVGTVLEFSCDNVARYGNSSLAVCNDTLMDSLATEGFAVAMADHPVIMRYQGIDPMPDSAYKIKAAVRTLRAEGAALGLNGKIAVAGFSRGSGMALMLVTTDGMKEFEGRGEHTNTSSSVQGAVIMSGRFTYLDLLPDDSMITRYAQAWGERTNNLAVWRNHGALDYLHQPTLPLFLTINSTESAIYVHHMDVLRQRLTELKSPFTFLPDPERRGHKVPLFPDVLNAMEDYLKKQLN